ncbi:MAG: hypothetical protein IK072_04310 [Clostridia bacterium]|nr:hypothetical protein [Clostridia bacterium]
MAAVLVFVIVSVIAVKTFSYGIWEAKRRNAEGAVFAILLALGNVILAVRYLVKYLT